MWWFEGEVKDAFGVRLVVVESFRELKRTLRKFELDGGEVERSEQELKVEERGMFLLIVRIE